MKFTRCKLSLTIIVFFFLILDVFAFALRSLLAENNIEPTPIRIGEVLTFSARIKHISAGTQMMRVTEKTTLNGQSVYHLESTAKTKFPFSLFYKFEDARESFVTIEQFQPLRYVKNIIDRKYVANVQVDFDVTAGTARLLKKKLSKNQEQSKKLEVPVGIQDELSLLYFIRTKELKIGEQYIFPALIGAKTLLINIDVVRKERTKTVLGKVETIVLRSSHGYMVWLTNDKRRIPVRIEAETKIGKLVGDLKKVEYI